MSRHRLLTKRKVRRAFDEPYILTVGKDDNGTSFVRYQLLPASIYGHRVNTVYFDIEVNPDGSRVKFPSGYFHCITCKLMGSIKTLQEYTCV